MKRITHKERQSKTIEKVKKRKTVEKFRTKKWSVQDLIEMNNLLNEAKKILNR